MSIESWKKEFISSDFFTNKTQTGMVNNQIKKFKGTLPKNLEKHAVTLITSPLTCILTDGTTCSLCPIFLTIGERCDASGKCFHEFRETGSPDSMLEVLNQIKDELKED